MSTTKPKSKTTISSASASQSANNGTTTPVSKFYLACRNNDIDAVASLLPKLSVEQIDRMEPNGSTALHAAAYYGNHEIVKMLLSKGAQRTIKNRYGSTPCDEAKTDDLRKLLEHGDKVRPATEERFVSKSGPLYEWIFVDGDPSSYASFNRESLMGCGTEEEFLRLSRGVRQHYIGENSPLANVDGIAQVRAYFDSAIQKKDPTLIARAYTAHTGFYKRLNEDLSQLPTHWSGIKHERSIVSILTFHPIFKGFVYRGNTFRGMSMSLDDLKQYKVGALFMNKTLLSTSKVPEVAEDFLGDGQSLGKLNVICKYSIKHPDTALDVESLSEFKKEKEVVILPYAAFRVKSVRKSSGITEIEVEEDENQVKWTKKHSHSSSHSHVSVHKTSSSKKSSDHGSYAKMFQDAQEKGTIDPADLAKWKGDAFGIDPAADTYAKMWSDAKKGKFSKSDLAKWKQQTGVVSTGGDDADSDVESYDGDKDATVFTASNQQSYATSKKFSSKQPFDLKKLTAQLEDDSDE